MIDTPCVIFAGGKSSRMGSDKSLIPFGGFDTMTEYQIDKLQKIFSTIYISCKDKVKFKSLKNYDSLNFIEEDGEIYAPTIGFISVFETLKCDRFFAISVDTPFIDYEIIKKNFDNDSSGLDAVIAVVDGMIQPMCGLYHKSMYKKFNEMLKDKNYKLGYGLKNSNTNFVDFKCMKKFLNINYPSDYKKALELI
ncbi:MAG: molybdenum cofactor guanylyltransferase MobA [Campylobacterales bacterium]|nr:molybdenum cofactor guanylyltransferase MobA [Campylobacterales bacterium]